MSWSGSVLAQFDEAEDAINAVAVSPDSDAPDQVAQVAAAKVAAVSLIKSGAVVVGSDQDVSIYISGHANPGHLPTAGYANDSLQVSITQVTRSTADA